MGAHPAQNRNLPHNLTNEVQVMSKSNEGSGSRRRPEAWRYSTMQSRLAMQNFASRLAHAASAARSNPQSAQRSRLAYREER